MLINIKATEYSVDNLASYVNKIFNTRWKMEARAGILFCVFNISYILTFVGHFDPFH